MLAERQDHPITSEELEGKRAEAVKICCISISKAIGMEVCVCEQLEAALRDWELVIRTDERLFSKEDADLIQGISKGWTNSELANALGWPEHNVAQCIDRVLRKLKLSSRIEVAFYAATEEGKAALRASAA